MALLFKPSCLLVSTSTSESPSFCVVQGVDTQHFDPASHTPYDLSQGTLVFGTPISGSDASGPRPFRFLSVFKWEARKNWPMLLKAYVQEFRQVSLSLAVTQLGSSVLCVLPCSAAAGFAYLGHGVWRTQSELCSQPSHLFCLVQDSQNVELHIVTKASEEKVRQSLALLCPLLLVGMACSEGFLLSSMLPFPRRLQMTSVPTSAKRQPTT